ncbi:MAG: Ppx/GppA family phosphatase [Desulfuromonadales bacterium]|nr:Ppx/GppA family phosphatase [Desulfuromonadales bacterium]
MREIAAAIDLGTNSARLIIGEVAEGKIFRHKVLRRITRLGGGFSELTGISDEAKQRTISALSEFAQEIKANNVSKIRAVGTSAVRDAVNGKLFCEEVLQETGIDLQIIDGKEEGLLTLQGVQAGLDKIPKSFLLFDIGGGSTEYTIATNGIALFTKSLPMGVVRLTEGCKDVKNMSEKISAHISEIYTDISKLNLLPLLQDSTLIGAAGTVTTLAAINMKMADYDYRKVNNHVLSLAEILEIYDRLKPFTPEERLVNIVGLEKGREDLILAGTIMTIETMKKFGFNKVKVSDFGLLEGLLLSVVKG